MAADPSNAIVAHTLHWLAVLMEIDDGDDRRVEAFRQAAFAVRKLDQSVAELVRRDGSSGLERLGFARDVAVAVADWVRTGELPELTERRPGGQLWSALTRALCNTLGIQRGVRPPRPSVPRRRRSAWESWQ